MTTRVASMAASMPLNSDGRKLSSKAKLPPQRSWRETVQAVRRKYDQAEKERKV